MTSRRLLLFDVDGTLVDVAGAGRAAVSRAMREVFGETGPVETFEFAGKTDPAIVRGLLQAAGRPDGAIDRGLSRLWPRYLAHLERELAARARDVCPQPGVPELLDALSADPAFDLALVTGNVKEGAWRKLRACGLRRHFELGAFGSDSEVRDDLPPLAMERVARNLGRRYPEERVWVIGDTPADVRCGLRSGLRVLAVATGRHDRESLQSHGPHRVLEDLRDTRRVTEILSDGRVPG